MDTYYKIVWAKYPFIRIAIPYIIGIIAADYIHSDPLYFLLVAGLFSILLVVLHRRSKQDDRAPYWFGLLSFVFWLSFSVGWTTLRDERNLPLHYHATPKTELLTKTYYLEEKDRFWDCYSDVIAQMDSTGLHPANGHLLLRINKSYSYTPNTRDIYQGEYKLITADGPSAPYEFDWNTLLHRRDIHYITYVDTARIKIIQSALPNLLERSRTLLDHALQDIIPDARDYPVASAMLIGLRKKMDPELYRAYSATGAVHVLSVSGMHVGILASILELFFGLIKSRKKPIRILKPILIILIIWLYTFLTGATPSILRSALMFSCFILARNIQRDAAAMNILAATAFILLIINPQDIFNIGFQLSFGAMAGIFLLYEPIRQSMSITNPYLQTLWKIMAVSLAAQSVIYPIVGYHFHQFAFYFWLTSLISSPFSFVILIGGMVALPLYFLHISWLHYIYYPLIYSVRWMNDVIAWVYTLPLGRVRGWWPSILECIILIGISIVAGQYLVRKSFKTIGLVFVLLILFMSIMFISEIYDQKKSELIATNNRNHPEVWVKHEMSLIQLVGDSTLIHSNYAEKYNIQSQDIIRLDSSRNIYKSDSMVLSTDQITIGPRTLHWITKRTDTLPGSSHQDLIIIAKYWKNKFAHSYNPRRVYTTPITDENLVKTIFPQSQIIHSKRNYVQIPIR